MLSFLRITGVYFGIIGALEAGNLLMGLISQPNAYTKIEHAVTAVYFVTAVWFCWRFYTGVCRDGDFLD